MTTAQFRVLGLLGLLVAAGLYLAEVDASARAGGGISSGSRGSRSYSSPSRPSTSPSRPQPSTQPPPLTSAPAPQPAPSSPFWRSMAGGLAGGFLGAMLFRGLAGAGGFGGLGGGFPLLDILLLAAIGYGIYWWVKKRREEQPVPAEGYYEREAGVGYYGPAAAGGTAATQEPLFQEEDLQRGLSHIRQMDARFDEAAFREVCTDTFFRIEAGWMNREVDAIANLLTTEMQNEFRRQLDGLKRDGRINRLENIAVRSVDITEAWQESGQDYITTHFLANLLDYTVDERSGQVVEGSKTEPVKFEEYWTWTRPVGPSTWRLSAINQAN